MTSGGCSLNLAFTQDDACATRSTQARPDKEAESFEDKKQKGVFNLDTVADARSVGERHAGPEESDDNAPVRAKKGEGYDKIQHTKVGMVVAYTKGTGTIVKKDGAYLDIYNDADDKVDKVHVAETYIPGDTISMGIMNQLWDQMTTERHTALLRKANIKEPMHFASRMWRELPDNLQDAIKIHSNDIQKKSKPYTSVGSGWANPPKGAVQDKNPGKPRRSGGTERGLGSAGPGAAVEATGQTKRTKPSRVFREVDGKKQSMTERQGKRHDEGVKQTGIAEQTMADYKSGKATGTVYKNDEERAVAVYQLNNFLHKVSSSKLGTPSFAPLPGTSQGGPKAVADSNTKVKPDQVRTRRGSKQPGYPGQKQDQAGEGRTIGDALADKSDVELTSDEAANPDNSIIRRKKPTTSKSDLEHGAYGGVVTDTPHDADGDYEDDKRHQTCTEFQHEGKKKPEDHKDGANEVLIGFHKKEIGETDEVEKEGGGAVTTGTVGANNPTYDEKKIRNKYNTRTGPRQVTPEEAEAISNRLAK